MKILWFTWKDRKNPLAGGAELVNEELAKRLVQNGHKVIFLVGGFENGAKQEIINGYKIIRLGNRWTVYWKAYRYYKKYLVGWADLIIDECNTLPFFCKYYVQEKTVFLIQQFAKEIWFYQMFFPLNIIGYALEPLYLRLFKDQDTFTFAKSTKNDLVKYGFNSQKITILKETFTVPIAQDYRQVKKYQEPTILFLSAIREMKRPDHIIKAFEIAKKTVKNLKLNIAGDGEGKYYDKIIKMINESPYKDDIIYFGKVGMTDNRKIELLKKSHYICCASIREGWGIIVSEAGSQGTPAIVYNVNGLKDAVNYGKAGIICEYNNPQSLAYKIIKGFTENVNYDKLRKEAFDFSKKVNIETSYNLFINKIKQIL